MSIDYTVSERKIHSLCKSSVKKIHKWMECYDVAIISAHRCRLENVVDSRRIDQEWTDENYTFTPGDNKDRSSRLDILLRGMAFGITKIPGAYLGGQKCELPEDSYFVVNRHNDPDFKTTIIQLGEYFNQDSILYKSKDSKSAYRIGTNSSEHLGYHVEQCVGEMNFCIDVFMDEVRAAAEAFTSGQGNSARWETLCTFSGLHLQSIPGGWLSHAGFHHVYGKLRVQFRKAMNACD